MQASGRQDESNGAEIDWTEATRAPSLRSLIALVGGRNRAAEARFDEVCFRAQTGYGAEA